LWKLAHIHKLTILTNQKSDFFTFAWSGNTDWFQRCERLQSATPKNRYKLWLYIYNADLVNMGAMSGPKSAILALSAIQIVLAARFDIGVFGFAAIAMQIPPSSLIGTNRRIY
jgi:hypothetical protein